MARVAAYARWHLAEKPVVLRFERRLDAPIGVTPAATAVSVRGYAPPDWDDIQAEFYPLLQQSEPDRRLFEMAPGPRACFVAAVDGRIRHYSWVHFEVEYPALRRLAAGDALIGPCFTHPDARGLGVYAHVLTTICAELRRQGFRRALIETSRANTSSQRGIEKAGFRRCASR